MYTVAEYPIPDLHYGDGGPQLVTWVVLDANGNPLTHHTDIEEATWRAAWHTENRERLVRYRIRAATRLVEEMKEYHT